MTIRMWGVNPRLMCDFHLNEEHTDVHTFADMLRARRSIKHHVRMGYLDPYNVFQRHEELVKELTRRGLRHNTSIKEPIELRGEPLIELATLTVRVDKERNLDELTRICSRCKERARTQTLPKRGHRLPSQQEAG